MRGLHEVLERGIVAQAGEVFVQGNQEMGVVVALVHGVPEPAERLVPLPDVGIGVGQ
jgi:hypothetical protein